MFRFVVYAYDMYVAVDGFPSGQIKLISSLESARAPNELTGAESGDKIFPFAATLNTHRMPSCNNWLPQSSKSHCCTCMADTKG